MPITGLHHIDLAVSNVERSLEFYRGVLGPLGLTKIERFPSYRGTEEVVYLHIGVSAIGLRPADGGAHRYYGVGLEHFAVFVSEREEVDQAYQRCLEMGANVHHPPEADNDLPDYWAMFVFDPDGMRLEIAHWPAGDPPRARA